MAPHGCTNAADHRHAEACCAGADEGSASIALLSSYFHPCTISFAQLAQRQPAGGSLAAAPAWLWQLQAAAALHGSRSAAAISDPLTGITKWLAQRMPTALGGIGEGDLDLETFASTITNARRMGGLTGFMHGTAAVKDSSAQGAMRMFEQIIGAMWPEEKRDLALFDGAARKRVAADVGCTTGQVDDCIARFLWTRQMTRRLAELKKEGKELPTSMDALEQQLGTWRQYKSEHENADGSSSAAVPLGHLGHKGRPCPLAGVPVGRNTKCPATKKSFKVCCGKTLQLG
ncbi:hypothetical protein CHLNCDRAFT_143567 [Chlorella variabilis]|uniref:Signal recognition particle SRP54 subunit M-domain domain-containing protein n=1 Tax=Chlorella variabilis TaxID=554065 RepID=E1ZB71_CHLVA|nr:hypothetical protein CHLNCDRAFT_143567 [Chlorella variabilis]EFN57177.1 hypothetical protein CHLNCDRAFT_143567 [Chlorella variabilis]|eukprot:XP_005849279.1 hypothetical protein CHLNCDRAFT_143567 [Chlorella variabilis]